MNRISPGLCLSKALLGFEQFKAAEGISPGTLVSYAQHLRLLIERAGDIGTDQVTPQELRAFLAWLRSDYKPRRITGDERPLSSKTVRNAWVSLCSFFSWASREFNFANPCRIH